MLCGYAVSWQKLQKVPSARHQTQHVHGVWLQSQKQVLQATDEMAELR
jgi:hypothetical protein